ncbi:aminodeoxychorismate lyase [Rhodococcus rhodnii]|uniref:4-amino-4-deoxychorismate lyase n=2 Tax=Rhodococcus rhodnii TaxID=38312 RepID=R7WK77_9NOCA|nr:aminodeoxychorismate lyase [Rhodococcus rhodnii]EOM74394.1 4-amino-4-deoxychorismate lyase [Rhodococcus rhodnii LMG 5362]TXG92276.1 aminodeoxychorismate lyase [Rhodococcus rhodnii]
MSDRVLVSLRGEVLDPDAPLLRADDLGVVRGDGVFETLLVRGGRPMQTAAHLERMQQSAAMLDLAVPSAKDWLAAIDVAATQWGDTAEGAMRLVCTRGPESGGDPTAFVSVSGISDRVHEARTEGVTAITLTRGFSVDLAAAAPWQLLGAKTLSYATNMAALRYAEERGAREVVFVSSEGFVLEGPRSTVVVSRDGVLTTPPPAQGILPGTTQRALFALAARRRVRCEYAAMRPADLITADGVWLVSSVTLAARVHTLDGLVLPEVADGAAFSALVDDAIEQGEQLRTS